MDKETLTLYYETQLQLLQFRLAELNKLSNCLDGIRETQIKNHKKTQQNEYWIDYRNAGYHHIAAAAEIAAVENQLSFLTTKLVELHNPISA